MCLIKHTLRNTSLIKEVVKSEKFSSHESILKKIEPSLPYPYLFLVKSDRSPSLSILSPQIYHALILVEKIASIIILQRHKIQRVPYTLQSNRATGFSAPQKLLRSNYFSGLSIPITRTKVPKCPSDDI